jgi:hypothetical protein
MMLCAISASRLISGADSLMLNEELTAEQKLLALYRPDRM